MGNDASHDLLGGLILAVVAQMLCSTPVQAHGVVGKRFLPGTIVVDDPFVADEASIVVGHRKLPPEDDGKDGGSMGIQTTTYSAELGKRLTPNIGISLGATYQRVTRGDGSEPGYGFDNASVGAKYQVLDNVEHEAVVSLGLDVDLGGTGSRKVGAESFSTISPGIFYGKGFGDLPDGLKYLRPLAVTGVLSPELPTRHSESHRLNWGFTVQYSLQYLQTYVRDMGLGAPFNRMIALVEVPVVTCLSGECSGQTTGTLNPGLTWFGKYTQIALEAAIPINRRSGRDVGVFFQIHLFLDDMFLGSISKPTSR